MERERAKNAGRNKFIRERSRALKEKPPRKAPANAAMKQAGRHLAIDGAKKQLREAQQRAAPEHEQESYSATEKVESYAANAAYDAVYYATHRRENAFHRETHCGETPDPKAPTPKERMRREAVKGYRQSKADRAENAFHHETDYGEAPTPQPQASKDRMRLEAVEEYQRDKPPTLRERMRQGIRKTQDFFSSEQPDKAGSVKAPTTAQGQRQTALPRNTSSGKAEKRKLIREQGRKALRDSAIREIKTGSARAGNQSFKALSTALTKALTPSREALLYTAGALVLIIIPFVVIMGVASILTSTGKGRDNYVPVSEDVEGYRPLIRQYANEYGIPEYEDLIAAVMMQESGGQTSDPMQCSESGYNTEYPRVPGGITDPEYSIKVGVQTLAEVLSMAGVESPIDLDGISLALQGYNYGSGYISWALANYGGFSELNAIEYSDMMAEQYGWSGYGDKAYVSHVLRYYPIGRSFMAEGDAAIVAVAQTQIGNEGGLKYCEWYGYPYRVEWCAIFVSWCADQCGYLDAGILPKELNVIPYVEWFRERNQWQYMDYEPSPGDLIFYDWEGDGLADHVGIVERVEDGVIYSIEGNAGDLCIENSHPLGAAPVYGFGLPAY